MRTLATVLLTTSCAAALAGTADAASIVYLDQGKDVAIARPDGTGAKKVTHATDAANGFKAVSVADDGGITAFLAKNDDNGNASFVVLNQDGSIRNGPFLFEKSGLCGGLSPFRTATSPDGAFVAALYWRGSDNCVGGSYTPSTRLISRNTPTTGTSSTPSYDYLTEPHWLRHPDMRLAGINGGTISVWQNDATKMNPWIALPGNSPYEFNGFDFHPTRTLLMLDLSAANTTGSKPHRLEIESYTEMSTGNAAPTDPAPQFVCALDGYVTNDTGGGRPSWSPDGTQIAWSSTDGIYVSPAPVADGETCVLQPNLVIPGGSDPRWAPFDVTTPAAPAATPPPVTPTSPPATTKPPAGVPAPAAFTGAKTVAGRRAFTVQLTLPKATTVTITVSRGRTRLGRLTVRAGKGSFRRKVTKVGRHRLTRGTYKVVIQAGTTKKTLNVKVRS